MKGFQFKSMGENRFILQFNHPLDRTHAMEGCTWLLDRCTLLLSLIPLEANPGTMELNMMTIVMRLTNIPMAFRKPDIARRLYAKLGNIVEVIPPKGDFVQTYLRVNVEINIFEPLQRGVYLRLRDGSRKWGSFSYE